MSSKPNDPQAEGSSRLERISVSYRKAQMVKNPHNISDPYVAGHPDALATGDENGKGESTGGVGGKTDIKTRESLTIKNIYNSNNEYNAGNA
jgi:hypothetical protein